MITVGQTLPAGLLTEFVEVEGNGCSVGPNQFEVSELVKDKTIVIFGLPGAFTPTCSAKHLPGYISQIEGFKAKGVDEVWCFAVNDAFVMHAWGVQQGASGKVRMMADGSAAYTQALGLTLDLTTRHMGIRCQRFAMIIKNGVVSHVAVEAAGQFEVSSAEAILNLL